MEEERLAVQDTAVKNGTEKIRPVEGNHLGFAWTAWYPVVRDLEHK